LVIFALEIIKRHLTLWQTSAHRKRSRHSKSSIPEKSDNSALYEDAFTSRQVSNFRLSLSGTLTWKEDGKWERETMFDDDEANDYLKFWKACLRRAKKYWSMATEELDAIYDFKKDDIEITED